ncbi:hypothetical protein KP509_03G072200 [Ceratopteris richardii]|uniref:Uncharacterized protein n=1 Tax=Ceratopteris richardii TaxID=49495 RepID=A0A8T2V523_CERRI|nr:hypothetical protein KP509_03G072200 [Ceratopteris richardii]
MDRLYATAGFVKACGMAVSFQVDSPSRFERSLKVMAKSPYSF